MTWASLVLGVVLVVLLIVSRRLTPAERPWFKDPVNWSGLVARLLLGGALLWAGLAKIGELDQSVDQVAKYEILPNYSLVTVVGYALPIGETVLGVLIIAGVLTRYTAALGGLLMAAFIIAIASLWVRGIWMDCGCTGDGADLIASEAKFRYTVDIIRDCFLVLAAVWLWRRPRSVPSVDQWLFQPLESEADHPAEPASRRRSSTH
jgi:uncharacterized membrane protein YphA (DoxX/SURF4 family)